MKPVSKKTHPTRYVSKLISYPLRFILGFVLIMLFTMNVGASDKAEIKWYPWEKASFELADIQQKPVLLDITATWCHWCMVMEETSYSDPKIVEIVNQDYIAVRVDADRRPDIVNRYSAGGFPTTAILQPSGAVIASATYVPPKPLLEVLLRLKEYVKENPSSLETDQRLKWNNNVQPINKLTSSIVTKID